jgi:hypothetical protein
MDRMGPLALTETMDNPAAIFRMERSRFPAAAVALEPVVLAVMAEHLRHPQVEPRTEAA